MDRTTFAKWTAIVLTCKNEQIANVFQKGPNSYGVEVHLHCFIK